MARAIQRAMDETAHLQAQSTSNELTIIQRHDIDLDSLLFYKFGDRFLQNDARAFLPRTEQVKSIVLALNNVRHGVKFGQDSQSRPFTARTLLKCLPKLSRHLTKHVQLQSCSLPCTLFRVFFQKQLHRSVQCSFLRKRRVVRHVSSRVCSKWFT